MAQFRSKRANCGPDLTLLAPLTHGWEYTMFVDNSEHLESGEPIFAQVAYALGERVLADHGFEMLSPDDVDALHALSPDECIEVPAFTGTPIAEVSLAHRKASDTANRAALKKAGHSPGMRWRNVQKWWVAGAPKGRAHLMGWWVPNLAAYGITSRKGAGFIQPRPAPGSQGAHDSGTGEDDGSGHADDGTGLVGKRRVPAPSDTEPTPDTRKKPPMSRSTIRLGSKGHDVTAWQMVLGVKHDGHFGPATQLATEAWQRAHGLAPDGVVGARSWAAAGQPHAPSVGPGSPACRAALRDANAAWPGRSRISDGIMGDASHMARKSDHNLGNAVDITHDPAAGCDGDVVSRLAMLDPRVTYVIWDRRIWNPSVSPDWRPYTGSNGHTHHVHVSVSVARRDDDGSWPWAAGVVL